ncbi:methyl-accepting chemotaxis protein [Herbaspirillum sp. SJZ107]|uniref:methyl-accepting chemotaxis protein n=1 Tax=Herbaspirillum sp. SJZ107 TaxID=2572881 RepID=UPI001166CEE7|nr:methyl-accepting chemotaxis protein [Herbaspirillum sp. SJZ107]TQK07329.1 methyl-accepting chemotaxis protein [Herbaspirillum sp. SJZ107]
MNFKNMRVGTRLALGYGLVFCLLGGIVATGVFKMQQMQARTATITDVNNVQITLIGKMQDSISDRMIALRNLALLTDMNAMRPEAQRIRDLEAAYKDAMAQLGKTFEDPATTPEEKAFFRQLQEQEHAVLPLMAEAEKLGLANNADEATPLLMNKVGPLQAAWLDTMNKLARWEEKLNNDAALDSREAYHSAVTTMLLLAAIAVVVGVGSALLVSRSLLKQLGGEPNEAAEVARRIAAGDLTVEVQVKPNDRASLMLAMRDMRDKLAAIVAEVRAGTDTIATAAAQVSTGNLDLSARTEQQAGSLEETASSMEELTSTVRQNADNAQQANTMAVSASEVAQKGGQIVAEVVGTMDAITTSAKKITDIISVIDGIAFQTNILALNAAVEAARAGEQGRGFAVVAGEVRNLAHRAGSAAKEIKLLIDDSVQKVGAGSALVGEAGVTMDEIVGRVKGVTDIMAEISAASREQSSGIEQVNQAISQMDQVTQQNAALVEEASAASQAMQDQAARLAELVGTFKLAAGGAPGRSQPAARRHAVPAAASLAKPAARKPAAVENTAAWEAF